LELNCLFIPGAIELAKAIENNATLVSVDLSFNGIGRCCPPDVTPHSTSSLTFHLFLGSIGAKRIEEAMKRNSSIQKLLLEGNQDIDEDIIAQIHRHTSLNNMTADEQL